MGFLSKTISRRGRIRKEINPDAWGFRDLGRFINPDVIYAVIAWLVFTLMCVPVLGYDWIERFDFVRLAAMAVIVILICLAAGLYVSLYQKRIIKNPVRVFGLAALLTTMLVTAKISVSLTGQTFWATATAVTTALILTITFSQRFASAMIFFYCTLAYFATASFTNLNVFFTMIAASLPFCFFLSDIRTRMRLLEVSLASAVIAMLMSTACGLLVSTAGWSVSVLKTAGTNAAITLLVGVLMQGLLPVIEKVFRIATSMTLLDYSDANQPLLRRLAIEAPGTFSHSLLIGTIAEAAAEGIGRNGLLCRVGAYYHDIGKINKPGYFVENQLGSVSWHKELSPQMSQLIIVGHIKDGMELAEEYGLPAVLRQFIETHHGTTLVEYFYDRAVKQHEQNGSDDSTPPSEGEFRYPGPKPRTKEAAIVMIADAVEGAVRSLSEPTPTKIEAVVHNMALKRLQDGQFDECDLSLREISRIEASISKSVAAHYHGRIAYPKPPEIPPEQV